MGGRFVSSGRAPRSKSSTIQIARLPTYWVDLLRAYRIYIDNQYVGKLHNGATAEFSAVPGLHEVYLRIDWCGSQRVQVQCAPGDVVWLNASARNVVVALGAVFFAWNEYLQLFAIPGPDTRTR
jgi:hypothetical protein